MTASTATKPDLALAWRTIVVIDRHPDAHTQEHYRCTAGMCFAGWAATLAGAQWLTGPDGLTPEGQWLLDEDDRTVPPKWAAGYVHAPGFNGRDEGPRFAVADARHVHEWARDALGISAEQADWLFDQPNTREELRAMVAALDHDPGADLGVIVRELRGQDDTNDDEEEVTW